MFSGDARYAQTSVNNVKTKSTAKSKRYPAFKRPVFNNFSRVADSKNLMKKFGGEGGGLIPDLEAAIVSVGRRDTLEPQ